MAGRGLDWHLIDHAGSSLAMLLATLSVANVAPCSADGVLRSDDSVVLL